MKKKLHSILFLAMCINLQSFSNPLPVPEYLKISEFMFNSDNTWKLELVDSFFHCDSLLICSSTGRAKVINFQENNLCGAPPYYHFSHPLILITQDDLNAYLPINQEGDSITIVHFCCGGRDNILPKTVLTFGNYPNAMVGKPAEGQSIVGVSSGEYEDGEYTHNYYSKNDKPSFGDCDKDESYMCGKLQGKIYDKDGFPLCNRTFILGGYQSQTDNEGNYNLNVYSNTLILDTIRLKKYEYYYWKFDLYGIVNLVQIDVEVGDIIGLDIHVIGDLVVSSPEVKISNNPIKIYPNPIKKGSMLNYEIELPILTANIELEVLSLSGQLLLREKITDNTGTIDLQKQMPSGIYILNCLMNGKSLYSTRIVITE